jgi:hypothetical protein
MRRTLSLLAVALLAANAGSASAAEGQPSGKPTRARPRRAILVVMDEVVERLIPSLLEAPSKEARRVSVRGGLLGLGSWSPPGGEGYGVKAPPIHLFPRAGMGQSLNVDPITGRSYFGWP